MRASELRSSACSTALPIASSPSGPGRRRGRVEPGVVLFQEGEHADFWWVLVDGAIELMRRIGREHGSGGWTAGLWAGGFRAWDEQGVYLATGRGVRRAGPPGARRGAADLLNAWFPFGRHLIEGLYGTARSIESMARQRQSLLTLGSSPPDSRTRSTTRLLPPAGRPTHSRPRARSSRLARPARQRQDLGRAVHRARRAAPRNRADRPRSTHLFWATTRRPCPRG